VTGEQTFLRIGAVCAILGTVLSVGASFVPAGLFILFALVVSGWMLAVRGPGTREVGGWRRAGGQPEGERPITQRTASAVHTTAAGPTDWMALRDRWEYSHVARRTGTRQPDRAHPRGAILGRSTLPAASLMFSLRQDTVTLGRKAAPRAAGMFR